MPEKQPETETSRPEPASEADEDRPFLLRAAALVAGKRSPAWGSKWVIPERDCQVGRACRFRMTLAHKKFISGEDVLAEAKRIRKDRGCREVERRAGPGASSAGDLPVASTSPRVRRRYPDTTRSPL
jgi:hypothetical protein